jgi:hypothetical protein
LSAAAISPLCWDSCSERVHGRISGPKVGKPARGKHSRRVAMGAKDHSARPEQTSHGFEEGQDNKPDSPEEVSEGRFSRGQERKGPTPEKEAPDRFSKGQETTGESPDKRREGRFSKGLETTGESPDKRREGGFSEGQESA